MPRSIEETRPAALPSGTVVFLFTDIEGSTQRWERYGDAMKLAVLRHEQIVRPILEAAGGYIFKTVGDAFCVAFSDAGRALRAACEAQRALSREDFSTVGDLRVRMGIHAGITHERDADYFGPPVNRVARLMSIGHGGQVLLSGYVRELISSLPPATELADLGYHRLKDLAEPEHVWQASIEGLATEFPPLNSLPELHHNLPVQASALRGRETELRDLGALLERHQLVTLLGAGGVGKTRLAMQVGADAIERFKDGVWFADLAPISDPQLVATIVANALGMNQAEGQQLADAIPRWLQRKQLVLILDNCEHVLDAAARLAADIQRAAPSVRVIATSRQPLGVSGEAVHRLSSLAVPE